MISEFWTGVLISQIPTILGLGAFILRIELKVAKATNDISWIKDYLNKCPQKQEDLTQLHG